MRYFDDIRVGDRVYVLGCRNSWTVAKVAGEFVEVFPTAYSASLSLRINRDGGLADLPHLGQLFYWGPVDFVLPTKPKRWVEKEAEYLGRETDLLTDRFVYRVPLGARNLRPPTYEVEE